MRILHLIDSLSFGGAETLLMSYIPELKEHQHTVVTLSGPNLYKREGYEYVELSCPMSKNIFSGILAIRNLIKSKKIQLVHSHSYWTNIVSRLAAPSAIPVLNHYHFADYDTYKHKRSVRFMIALDRLTTRKNLTRIAVSAYVKRILEKSLNNRIVVLPNFIVCKEVWDNQKQTRQELRIVSIANINVEKNLRLLIEAFKELRGCPVRIDVIGGGQHLELLKQEAHKQEVAVYFQGFVANAAQELGKYDLFLSASVSESFGISVLEGVCARLPLLLSNIPAFREIAPAGTIYFDPMSASDLADKIRHCLQRKIEIDNTQYEEVLDKYSMQAFLHATRNIYEKSKTGNIHGAA
jgi:glycosyltransferase involved in cell wall biosynthesis